MTVTDGKTAYGDPPEAPKRVVVKLREAPHPAVDGVRASDSRGVLAQIGELAQGAPISLYFASEALEAASLEPFNRYIAITAPNRNAAAALARQLNALTGVEEAYVEGGPELPPVRGGDNPRSGSQGYLDAKPIGIGARWAWSLTDGSDIGFVDLEQGWTLDHVDLVDAGITEISGRNYRFHGHGTSVLGAVVGVDNRLGGIGIAHGARARVVSQWRAASDSATGEPIYDTAAAILSAGEVMCAGDVLLLEAQTSTDTMIRMPVEVETIVFDAIRHVVDAGIVVIEAGGNGPNDLDTYRDSAGRALLDRNSVDFRDSGAVMVGAATSVSRDPVGLSNRGSRMDCFAWGENIVTSGDGWQGTSSTDYTGSFGNTSGASAIVAGAALLLQAWRKRRTGTVFSPATLRDRLSSPRLNTPSAEPAVDCIGVMPDLRAIIESEPVGGVGRNGADNGLLSPA